MKKITLLCAAVLSLFLSSALTACKHNLIPEPTIEQAAKKNPADYADAILPPSTVTATHGGYRNITLEWTAVENAVRYQIFYAKTPFDNFVKLVETADTVTTYDIEAPAGSTYYFYVKAVNFYETVSAESLKTTGSSLAIPIITGINASDDAQSVEIEWWMDNCNKETYLDNVEFFIKAYDEQKKEIPGSEKTAGGSSRSSVISGLSPSTKYYFTVEARIKDSEQKSESSDLTSKETTHSIVPVSVSDFKVTQGITHSAIELSWKLPEGSDYFDAFTNTYSTHPVMFNIQRKEINQDDSTYKDIAFIGIENKSSGKDLYSHPYKLTHSFDCTEVSTSDSKKLIINTTTSGGDIDLNNSYPKYKPGTTLTFRDSDSIVKGKQYTYRIISVTDDTSKIYKADSSVSDALNGWLFGPASFKATADYTSNEDKSKFTEITIKFDFNFVPFTTQYQYVITQTITPFKSGSEAPVPGEPEIIMSSDSISSIANKTITFNTEELAASGTDWKGSYKYKISINYKDSSNEDCSEVLEASGTIAVTDDVNNMPVINSFNVEDGYSDKFILEWDYNDAYSYIISWIPYNENNPLPEEKLELTPEDFNVIDGKATFNHIAVSGDVRTYCLTAENGLSVSKFYTDPENEDQNILCKTLGTAKPAMAEADYSTITVSWPEVQMADDYEISAKYIDNPDVDYDDIAVHTELLSAENCAITKDPDTGMVTCVISEVQGFDNPAISGLPIELVIQAKNIKDSTEITETVFNLGPALTFPETNKNPEADRLTFKWNKVEGADKYLVYRVLYSDKNQTEIMAADKYIVTTDEEISNDSDIGDRAKISYRNGKFTLIDKQTDAVDLYGYHLNQAKIQWGLPYGYVVLPLKKDSTKDTFQFKDVSLTLNESAPVNYGTLADTVTHTYGYGMNIRAGKSVSASTVNVSWERPNSKDLIPTVYRKPFKKDEAPEYGNSWEKVATLSQGATTYSDKLTKDNISSAFVYCVQYEASTASDIIKSYREQLLNTKDSENSPEEPLNKGYLLTLKNFDAIYGGSGTVPGDAGYYQENVSWSNIWDYKERALGPDSFTIDLKNKNLSCTKDWVTLASISIAADQDNKQTITANSGYTDSTHTENPHTDITIDVMAANNGITLKPTGLSEGTAASTSGLLQVLRDAKHYYSANLTRGSVTVRQAEDESVYAYRQISDEEFVKSAMIYLNEGLYTLGKLDFESKTFSGSLDGSITGFHRSTMNIGKGYDINLTNYVTEINTPQDSLVSLYKINASLDASRPMGTQGGPINEIKETSISISPYNEFLPSSYSGVIQFSLENEKKASLKYGSVDKTTSSAEERRSWVPFCIYNDETWYQNNSRYGWWN